MSVNRLKGLRPPSPLSRRLSLQAALFAVGHGVFLTGSAVYFTQIVGLSAAQVGLGLTLAGVVTFFSAIRLGRLADQVGPRRLWAVAAFVQGAVYLAYPFAHGFGAFLIVIIAIEVADAAGTMGRGAYTLGAFSSQERIGSLAYMRSALNLGATVGSLLGGLALAAGRTDLIRAVPIVTSVVLIVNAVLISRLPQPSSSAVPRAKPSSNDASTPGRPRALRNRGFLALNVCLGVLNTHQVLLNVVIPLWLVQDTDAPRWLLAWLFGTNTILVTAFQVLAARGAHTTDGALRATWRSAALLVVSCVVVMVTGGTAGWITIALLWLGHVVLTGAELFGAAAQWGFAAELSDPARRGEYQGVIQIGSTLGSVWAPAAFTFLATGWSDAGWLLIGAVVLVATVGVRPAARSAQAYLADHAAPLPVLSTHEKPAS